MAVLPIYHMIALPHADFMFRTDMYSSLTGRSPAVDDRVTIIVARREITLEEVSEETVYPIGVSGVIREVNSKGFIVIQLTHRVHLDEVAYAQDSKVTLSLSRRNDIEDLDEQEAQARVMKVKESMMEASRDFEWGAMAQNFISGWKTLEDIGAVTSPWMNTPNEKFYALLEEDSRRARFDALETLLYENMELMRVTAKVQIDQKETNQKMYREQALRHQIEYMQKELDEMHPEEMDAIRKLEVRIEEAGMNETARKEAGRLLNRLKSEGQQGQEAAMLMDYLEFLTSLPWKKETPTQVDLDEAERVLDADHFGLEKVKRRILEQIAVMQLRRRQSGSIILFVGAPGTGKTSIGQSIAKALGREYVRVSLGGVRDEADIRGHRRTYIGSMPGRIIDGIHKCGVSNPVMVLDEVDKLSASYQGDPASALLEVLDPEQNNTFTDHYLNVPYDLSDVLFICTANSMDTIPEPLLNRMEVIHFQGYTPIEKLEIARRHLLPKAMEAAGLAVDDLSVTDRAMETIIAEYTREAGVRGLKKRIDTLCRTAAVRIVRGGEKPVTVKPETLREDLDMSPIRQKAVRDAADPGVVTGLAWTSVGGDVLYIETKRMKGSGRLTITGQLGDVMKESAQIALSLVRSIFPDQAEKLRKQDLHIHVPDGATPKDGPSAGITLTTALSSLLTEIPVPPSVAMTGEVSLQGTVNPIGGLPEKLMAAQRAGVRRVYIPQDNVDDLKDVASEVRDQLEIIPVGKVQDVLTDLGLLAS